MTLQDTKLMKMLSRSTVLRNSRRFSAFSCREDFGVKYVNQDLELGTKAERVLDPIFLADKKHLYHTAFKKRRDKSQNKACCGSQNKAQKAYTQSYRKAVYKQGRDRGVGRNGIAHSQIAPEHFADIAEKLHYHRFVQTVAFLEGSDLLFGQLCIVERGAGHKLHQQEQHQQDNEQY